MSKADVIAQALRRRPGLLYEVLTALVRGQEPVLGPWEAGDEGHWRRHDPAGNGIAWVQPDKVDPGKWHWSVGTRRGGMTRTKGVADARLDAQVDCDVWLMEHGYLLSDYKAPEPTSMKLGPWGESNTPRGICERRNEWHNLVVIVREGPPGRYWGWTAELEIRPDVRGGVLNYDNPTSCMQACDAYLVREGYEFG